MNENCKIYIGEALEVLKQLPSESVDCVMTSPPYWALRDYGTATWEGGDTNCNHRIDRFGNRKVTEKTIINQTNQMSISGEFVGVGELCPKCGAKRIDNQIGLERDFNSYINRLCDIFDEVKRVLKPTGTCWVNIGDTYGGGGSSNNKGFNDRYRGIEHSQKETEKQNMGRIKPLMKSNKSLCQIPSRFAIEMQSRGWILRNEIIWHKPNCMPSSVKDRFTVDFEKIFFFVKSKKYWFETQKENEGSICTRKRKTAFRLQNENNNDIIITDGRNKRCVWKITTKPYKEAHFAVFPKELCETPIKAGCPEFVCNKCGKIRILIKKPIGEFEGEGNVIYNKDKPYSIIERKGFIEVRDLPELSILKEYLNNWRKKSNYSVEEIEQTLNSQAPHHWFSGESYPTKEDWLSIKNLLGFDDIFDKQMLEVKLKPAEKLAGKYKEILTNCGCNAGFSGGVVLDPFMGSGTTGIVALTQNKKFIGIDLNPNYVEIAKKRLKPYLEQKKLG